MSDGRFFAKINKIFWENIMFTISSQFQPKVFYLNFNQFRAGYDPQLKNSFIKRLWSCYKLRAITGTNMNKNQIKNLWLKLTTIAFWKNDSLISAK